MASRTRLLMVVCLASALVGCGGGGGKKGPSLDAQVKKAHAESDAGRKARLLAGLAEKQIKAGDVLAGESTLTIATEAANSVEDPAAKANSLIFVGSALARCDKMTEAKKALRVAATTLEEVKDAGSKAMAYADLGLAAGTALKNPDQATEYLKSADTAAEQIEIPMMRAAALSKIYIAYERSGRAEDAADALTKAKDFATGQKEQKDQVDSLAEIGEALSKAKKTDEAAMVFEEAGKIAEQVKADDARGYTYLNLARKLKQAGLGEEARKALSKADDAALKIKDGSIRSPLIAEIQAAAK